MLLLKLELAGRVLERIDEHRTEGPRVSGGYQCFLAAELAVPVEGEFSSELLPRDWVLSRRARGHLGLERHRKYTRNSAETSERQRLRGKNFSHIG